MGWEKVACWSTKAAISQYIEHEANSNISETRNDRGKVTWRAYRNSLMLSSHWTQVWPHPRIINSYVTIYNVPGMAGITVLVNW